MTKPRRVRRSYAIREDLDEVLTELSEDVVVGRNVIIERALERYFAELELPARDTDRIPPWPSA